MKIRRLQIGKWRFAFAFGSYHLGIKREAKRAGSVGLGFGLITYLKKGSYEPLPRGAMFAA